MVESVAREKDALRGRMSRRRAELPEEAASVAARAAATALLATEEARQAARIGMYAAFGGELSTRPLFDELVRSGVVALFPRMRTEPPLEFCAVERWSDLRPGALRVLEPGAERAADALGAGDLVVVPGLAFDAAGNRLGRGKAYYDRTFPNSGVDAPMLVGFGYEFQVVDRVPHGGRDRLMDAIVTERTVRYCTGDR